jgi:hypothetical protein
MSKPRNEDDLADHWHRAAKVAAIWIDWAGQIGAADIAVTVEDSEEFARRANG